MKSLALASKPQSPQKFPCPRLEDSTIFEQLKFRWKTPETSQKICEHLFCFLPLEHRCSQEGGDQGARPRPIEISPKTPIVSSVSVSFQHFSLTTLTNNNIEVQGPCPPPLNSIVASQFKRITRKKWRVFVLNVAISGPHLAFL